MRALAVLLMVASGLVGCSSKHDEIYGVVNGKTIRANEVQERLKIPESLLLSATMDQKRDWFLSVVKEIAVEDEAKRSKFSQPDLFRFFQVIEQVEISPTERAGFLSQFPGLSSASQTEIDSAIKKFRRENVERSYREQILKKTAYEFMADNPKRSKVQNFWDRISN